MSSKTEIITAFDYFTTLLKERFSKDILSTEDSIRYYLFYALAHKLKISLSDFVFEYPHPQLEKKRIDTFILPNPPRLGMVFEVKFDRKIPSRKNPPKTQKAGAVFADIFRLACFDLDESLSRYFVYVTDRLMAIYFQNPDNKLDNFFNLQPGMSLKIDKQYVLDHPKTFINTIGKHIYECDVELCLGQQITSMYWLRIFKVLR